MSDSALSLLRFIAVFITFAISIALTVPRNRIKRVSGGSISGWPT